MKYFLLFYELADDYLERRPEFRTPHLEKAWAASEKGELVLAGAYGEPDGALLLFQGEDKSPAENFAKTDPYVTNGLIKSWKVYEWVAVVGEGSHSPVRPGDV